MLSWVTCMSFPDAITVREGVLRQPTTFMAFILFPQRFKRQLECVVFPNSDDETLAKP